MKIRLERDKENEIEVRNLTIINGDIEFNISINNFDEVVVRKVNFGIEDSGISILPRVSNEIIIK